VTEASIRVAVLDVVSIAPSGGVPVEIGSLQQKLLLTLLVGHGNRDVTVDRIAEELWGDAPPRRWLASIRTLANALRTTACDREFVHWTGRGYRLHRNPARVRSDVDDMVEAADEARAAMREGRADDAERAARRALLAYGNGPWTTDYWHWCDLAGDCYHVLGRALLERESYLNCLVELSQVPEVLEWHDGVRSCLAEARAGVSVPLVLTPA
jgi:DNA-binding SARP family transcriptional activator